MRFLQVANESIEFQSSVFASALTAEFESLFEKFISPKDADKHPARVNIEKLISKHTGLNIALDFASDYPPCTQPVMVNTNHILAPDWAKSLITPDANKILDKAEGDKKAGSINLKEGKLHGIFTKAEAPIYMGVQYLQAYKLTSAECAAVLMHEIGHVFTFLEYMTRTVRTNQALAAVHKSLLANSTKDEHKVILERAGRLAADDAGAYIELTEIKDKQTVTTVIIHRAYFGTNRNELGGASANYDSTSAEQLADQFAARHGLGRDLITGLAKVMALYGAPEYSRTTRVLLMLFFITHLFFMPAGLVVLYGGSLGAGVAVSALFVFLATWSLGDNYRDRTYDDLRVRFKRIREQSIHYLKDNKVPPKEAKRVLEDINAIDKAIEQAVDYKPLIRIISNFIFPSNRAAMKAADLQRDLEELSANDIFVKAKELSFLK